MLNDCIEINSCKLKKHSSIFLKKMIMSKKVVSSGTVFQAGSTFSVGTLIREKGSELHETTLTAIDEGKLLFLADGSRYSFGNSCPYETYKIYYDPETYNVYTNAGGNYTLVGNFEEISSKFLYQEIKEIIIDRNDY